MKNILLIGVGGTGSNAVDILYEKIRELENQTGNRIVALVFDTDAGDISKIRTATPIPMADPNPVGVICDNIGQDVLKSWFPWDDPSVRAQEMVRGAAQWRKKSFLAFTNLLRKPDLLSAFHNAMDSLQSNNPGDSYEIYTIASIAGGTGAGSFIPITLYAKRYLDHNLTKKVEATAMLACPDIYADAQTPDNRVKIFSNAYAILRELNAINLVAHGHNDPKKKPASPINMTIGSKDSPTGILFDAQDPRYWTPEAAPFQKIFLLDKIPQLRSIVSHDIMLANALYTILCTEIGTSFDSEHSNHAILTASNNGYNAIYAGIATAALTYPTESILDYVAHRKAEEASQGEWLKLYNDTEARIDEEMERYKEARRVYILNDGDYAEKFNASVQAETQTPTSEIPEILRRCTEEEGTANTEGNTEDNNTGTTGTAGILVERQNRVEPYVKSLISQIERRIPDAKILDSSFQRHIKKIPVPKKFAKAADRAQARDTLITQAGSCHTELLLYYNNCLEAIRNSTTSLSDAILPLDSRKPNPCANESLSLVHNILTIKGSYIHPIAAMAQLCRIRSELAKNLSSKKVEEWKDLLIGKASVLPATLISQTNKNGSKNSAYSTLGKKRFADIVNPETNKKYKKGKTDISEDSLLLAADAKATAFLIQSRAKRQLVTRVLKNVIEHLDMLIKQYRTFFGRFARAREDLIERTKEALRINSGTVGSIINLSSTEKDKLAAYKLLGEAGPSSLAEIAENDHITGESVFKLTYNAALDQAENNQEAENRRATQTSFNALFDAMTNAYKKQIRNSAEFKKLTDRTLIEIISDASGEHATAEDIRKMQKRIFTELQTMATPSLQADNTPRKDIPAPSLHTVYLISTNTARYIKRNALRLGLPEPDSSASESRQMQATVENFLNYVGATGARVAIVDDISDHTIYVTRENLDLQPIQIRKFDELSTNPVYFENYQRAIANMEKLGTDMWNPHLGFNFHKRGYLPYINPQLEKKSDTKLAKALLYAILEGKLIYNKPLRLPLAFRYPNDHNDGTIRNSENQVVNTSNLNSLLNWLRPMTDLVEEWSAAYDRAVRNQCNALPCVITKYDIRTLAKDITESPYIEKLRTNIFNVTDKSSDQTPKMSLIEFAYAIKISEETSHDCDDAEILLKVGFQTLLDFCSHRISLDTMAENFASIYTQQLTKFMTAFLESEKTIKTGDPEEYVKQIITWMSKNECFRALPVESDPMYDAQGNLAWTEYKYPQNELDKARAKAKAQAKKDGTDGDGNGDGDGNNDDSTPAPEA
ncbi:MAG: hypothetical protein IJV98_02970 [Clostridia bacterium]|nr:hypothetical protein [Clostridia bacterium]